MLRPATDKKYICSLAHDVVVQAVRRSYESRKYFDHGHWSARWARFDSAPRCLRCLELLKLSRLSGAADAAQLVPGTDMGEIRVAMDPRMASIMSFRIRPSSSRGASPVP